MYPVIDVARCIHCNLCKTICPSLVQGNIRKPISVYAAKNLDEEIRKASSSGGIFSLLAEQVIDEGGVVFGACFDDRWEVIHDYTETKEGLARFRGSKYVQSNIGHTYKRAGGFLQDGRKVLFSGTPCQIAGLLAFLHKDYDALLCCDVICHGIPSPMVWREYLNENKKYILASLHNPSDGSSYRYIKINMHDKSYGWKRYSYNFEMKNDIDDTILSLNEYRYKNKYFLLLRDNIYLRPSCYNCPVKSLKSGSDITIGDYWGIEDVFPEIDDDMGISAVMINTAKGKEYYDRLNKEVIYSISTKYTDVIKKNRRLENSGSLPSQRVVFFKRWHSKKSVAALINQILTPIYIKRQIIHVFAIILRKIGIFSIVKSIIDRIIGRKHI